MDEASNRMEPQFHHELRSVGLDSSDSDPQQRGDLLIGLAFGYQANDFRLAWGCIFSAPLCLLVVTSCLEKSFDHDFGYFRSQETLALRNNFHGFR